MRYGRLASLAAAALIAAAPAAFAFEVQPTTANAGVGANFANNPDSQSDSMSANLAGNGGSPMLHFGGGSMSFSGGGSDMSPATQEQFMGGPGQIGNAISPH